MRASIYHHMSGGQELHTRLEWAKNDLINARKVAAEGAKTLKLVERAREAVRAEANKLRKESIMAEAKLKGAEQENSQLKKETKEL